MKTIIDYIDLAKDKNKFYTDAQLDYELGLKKGSVYNWRNARSWPEEKTIIKLAKLAEISEEQAILENSYWKADVQAKVIYKGLLERLVKVACIAFVFCGLMLSSTSSFASTENHTPIFGSIDYHIIIKLHLEVINSSNLGNILCAKDAE